MSQLVYFEEYLDTLSSLPHEISQCTSRLANLDSYSDGQSDLVIAIKAFQVSPSDPNRAHLNATLLSFIQRCAEKRAIAGDLLRTVQRYSVKLEDDLTAFQEELRVKISESSPPKRVCQKECFCGGKGRGEMIGCENKDCPVEWFHIECVGLGKVPPGKWFCRQCLNK